MPEPLAAGQGFVDNNTVPPLGEDPDRYLRMGEYRPEYHWCEGADRGLRCTERANGAIETGPLGTDLVWLCARHLKREVRKGWPRYKPEEPPIGSVLEDNKGEHWERQDDGTWMNTKGRHRKTMPDGVVVHEGDID